MQRAALLLLLVLAAPAAGQDPKKLPAEARPLQERINEAIDRGVAWLRKQPLADGLLRSEYGSAGATALALYTLVSSGAAKDDERVVAMAKALADLPVAAGGVQELVTGKPALRMTYDHSLTVLALASLDPKEYRRAIQRSVRVLVKEQRGTGQWNYLITMGGPLDQGDNSNTQFALLALRLAALRGFPVPEAVWRRSFDHFRKSLTTDGGWGYGCPGQMEGTYGSMTAVGVASLTIAKAMLLGEDKAGDYDYLKEPEIARGMIWLEDRFAADHHPGISEVVGGGGPPGGPRGGVPKGVFQYYWLYAVERVGMLLSRKYLGSHDWYREGAEWLVEEQREDGSWLNRDTGMMAPEPPLAATCFALLFLKKATLPVVTPRPEVDEPDRPR